MTDRAPLLDVEHLTTVFDPPSGPVPAVDDVSFEIRAGETLGLVGESGSGKSVTALSVMRLVQPPGRIAGRPDPLQGTRSARRSPNATCARCAAREIALIFQEPMTALNPVFTIGDQIRETLLVHGRATRRDATAQAVELLEAVRMPDAARARARLPASAVGRHAAARADRHGDGLPAVARHRRRADDRARRHHSGARFSISSAR